MDDFKYDRKPMGELMRYAEANLSEDQVTGDFLERDKDAIQEQRAAEEAAEHELEEAESAEA